MRGRIYLLAVRRLRLRLKLRGTACASVVRPSDLMWLVSASITRRSSCGSHHRLGRLAGGILRFGFCFGWLNSNDTVDAVAVHFLGFEPETKLLAHDTRKEAAH
jgi:hypothetical protein